MGGLETSYLYRPSLSEAVDFIRKALADKKLIVIIGKCSVDYEGRSESRLTSGERIVIVKQDGAFLVHRPTGHSPVNWQPDTSHIDARLGNECLEIIAVRRSPREIVRVYMEEIYFVYTSKLVDHGEFIMYLDESEIRDLLYIKPELLEDGLRFVEKEKKLPVGSIDLFGYDSGGNPVIVEVKRVTASRDAVYQLYRYVESYTRVYGVKPRGILVAPGFTSKAIESLNRLGLEYRQVNIQKLWRIKKELSRERTGLKSILDFIPAMEKK